MECVWKYVGMVYKHCVKALCMVFTVVCFIGFWESAPLHECFSLLVNVVFCNLVFFFLGGGGGGCKQVCV